MKVEFTVPGQVCAKERSRSRIIKTKDGRFIPVSYSPAKTVGYETLIREFFCIKYGNLTPTQLPVSLEITTYYPIPKSTSTKKRQLMVQGHIRPTVKPDFDNIEKIFADALTGIAFANDSQVVDSRFAKYYSETVRTEIKITDYEIQEPPPD